MTNPDSASFGVICTASLDVWQTQIEKARQENLQILPCGSGSHIQRGLLPEIEAIQLDTTLHQGIMDYDPAELVISARCGTTITHIEQLLAQHNQVLGFEPPVFSEKSTIGGIFNMGLSGPARMHKGPLRDYVLGARLINCRGEELCFGGKVIKNVAGYDVARLLAGARGYFGIISEVSLKVIPAHESSLTLCMTVKSSQKAIEQMNQWATLPIPLTATLWHDETLFLRFSSTDAVLHGIHRRMGGEILGQRDAKQLWTGVRHQTHVFFQSPAIAAINPATYTLWRIAVPPLTPQQPAINPEQIMLEHLGGVRWCWSDRPDDYWHDYARSAGGSAWRWHGQRQPIMPRPSGKRQTPATDALLMLSRNLKKQLDPENRFVNQF